MSVEPPDDLPLRAETLVAWAKEEGFQRAALTTLEPFATEAEAYRDWLERGDQAGMDYMERYVDLRVEPQRLLPGARWVLCVALRYAPREDSIPPDNDLWPRVARYARGRDYHNLMGKRLKKLARRIRRSAPESETRVAVDASPVLERALAQRAGLGTIGKNTCLLTREGSWFFLGEIFSSAPLAEKATEAVAAETETAEAETEKATTQALDLAPMDLCGSCTACLDACPTDALPEPFRLDSRRCISYWTIEHRGAMPEAAREQLHGWAFGCDICQEVCPWNQGTRRRPVPDSAEDDFRLPPQRAALGLEDLLELSEDRYRELFRGSPMQRARREGLQRNAATAMGESGDRRYIPSLERALEATEDPGVREHAQWALQQLRAGAPPSALEGTEDP
ncbi:MAG: QueG-associated DUF1730 domain-containing protein [Acidobacteriota bacterium]